MPGEKTEKATPKRREDERKKGHIAQSQDVLTGITMVCFFAVLKVTGASILTRLGKAMIKLYQDMPATMSGYGDMEAKLNIVFSTVFTVVLPIMIVMVAVNVIGTLAQSRMLVTASQLSPDFKRINPIEGMKRLFSMKSLVEFLKSLLKVSAIALIIYLDVRPQISKILLLFDTSLGDSLNWTAGMALDVGFKSSIAILIIGIGDYVFQWWSFEKEIRMSKQEIKDEYKQTEGNPEIKGRIRNLQRKLSRARMMQAVPKADVVIRNPTHFAVALKYDSKGAKAPVVVAKGQDNIALKIVEIAQKNKVFVTENRPLAQALYRSVEIGDQIPAEFYKAVAEVLAFIYRLKRAGRQ